MRKQKTTRDEPSPASPAPIVLTRLDSITIEFAVEGTRIRVETSDQEGIKRSS